MQIHPPVPSTRKFAELLEGGEQVDELHDDSRSLPAPRDKPT